MKSLLILLALVAGAFMPIQAGINSRLRFMLGDPISAAMISFAVGTLGLAAYVIAGRKPWPDGALFSAAPWWIWTGGLMGAFFVAASVVLAPRLGAAAMMAWLIAGQLTASIFLDHFGLVGYALREASPLRILGAGLLVAGAVLVQRF